MPDTDAPAIAALGALGVVLFIRDASGALRLTGTPPAWVSGIWPGVVASGAELPTGEVSPFLENFLIDADTCWSGGEGRARSGPWIERDAVGAEVPLEATAFQAGGQALLLIERLGEVFEAKKFILQKARENVIAYQRLNAEMQKKEILLHCVAEDMTASLANAITALRLIELEEDPGKTRLLLGLASRALEEQQSLIHKVLDVFGEDLDGFYGRHGDTPADADLRAVVRAALDELAPQFSDKRVGITPPDYSGGELLIAADAAHMHRVMANLLENALHVTPAGRTAAVRLEESLEFVVVRVDDEGESAKSNVLNHLFGRFDPNDPRPEPSLLRLHFCRIAMENCGGDIGCEPREGGGNCFWIRVPKARRAS